MDESEPSASLETPGDAGADPGGLTPRAVILSLLAILAFALIWPHLFYEYYAPGNASFLPLPILVVFVAACAAALLLRLVGVRLRRGELVTVFSALLIASSSFLSVSFLISLLPSANKYHSPETKFEQRFLRAMQPHLMPFHTVSPRPDDPEAADEKDRMEVFYRGIQKPDAEDNGKTTDAGHWLWHRAKLKSGRPSEKTVLDTWAGPLAWWLLLLGLLYGVQLCIAVILRKQWIENEKLMFPHARLIEDLAGAATEPGAGSLLRSGVFWIGFGISVTIFGFVALNHYFPNVPAIDIRTLSLAEYLSGTSWEPIRPELAIQPYALAIAFLLTAEMSLSVWVFAVIDQFCRVLAGVSGMPYDSRQAWVGYGINSGSDTFGAVVVLVLALLWTGRRQIREVVEQAFGRGDRGVAWEYRLAILGAASGSVGILWWCVLAGMSFWISLFLFGTLFMIFIYVSRVLSEVGAVNARAGGMLPQFIFLRIVGYQHETMMPTYAVFSYLWGPLVYASYLMPNVFTGLRLAGQTPRARWGLIGLMFAGTALAMVVFSYMTLQYIYTTGALNAKQGMFNEVGWIFKNRLIRDIMLKDRSHSPDPVHIQFMGIGAAVMAFLLAMRHFFHWWPLHPIGYVVSGLDGGIWFSFFLGWLAKRQVLKYGGGNLLAKVTPLFIGLFAGQIVLATVILVIGLIGGDMRFNVF